MFFFIFYKIDLQFKYFNLLKMDMINKSETNEPLEKKDVPFGKPRAYKSCCSSETIAIENEDEKDEKEDNSILTSIKNLLF